MCGCGYDGRMNTKEPLPEALLERMGSALRVLGHGKRLALLDVMDREGFQRVGYLAEIVNLTQATTSHHLTKMRDAGIVKMERRGKEHWYGIANPDSITILGCIRKRNQ